MPRRTIPFMPNQYYHIYNRGNNRQTVFFERENYLYFLQGIKKYLSEYVDILAYSLMPTHYHILVRVKPQTRIETSEVSKTSEVWEVSRGMQKLGISYTKAINKRFSRVGALFQGQFQGKYLEHYNHLFCLCIYIHANPVKDSLVALPEEWEFSNYREWMGMRKGTLVNREFIEDNFSTTEEYKAMVMEYIKTRNLPEDMRKYLQEFDK